MDKIEKIKGWVARDDDGTLAIHYEKPRRVCYYNNEIVSDGTPWIWENEAGYGLLPVKIFPDLKWEDEPLEVELTIKRASTLSEEPDKSLEEAAEIIAKNILGRDYLAELDEDCAIDALEDAKNFVKAGAEWQASQMPMPEDTVLFNKGVAEGRRLEREDMMKDISNTLAPDDPATNEEIKKMLQERRAMIEKEVQRRVFNGVEHCWEEAHHEGYIEGWNECEAAYKSK